MERYERAEGEGAAFWEVEVDGLVLRLRYGPAGEEGRSWERRFTTGKAVARERARLVREKRAEGYGLALVREPVPAGGAPPAGPLPTRAKPGPPFDAAADWAALGRLLPPLLDAAPVEQRFAVDWLRARLGGAAPDRVGADEGRDWARQLVAACRGMGQRIADAGAPPHVPACRACFRPFARWLAAAGGGPAVAAAALELRPQAINRRGTFWPSAWNVPAHLGLREAVAGLPDTDYAAVRSAFDEAHAAEPLPQRAGYFAFLLADDAPGPAGALTPAAVLAAVPQPQYPNRDSDWLIPLVADLPASAAAPWRANAAFGASLRDAVLTAPEAAATLVAVARGAGEPAAPSLLWLLRDALGDDRTALATAVLDTREDGALACLLPFLDEKLVRDVVDAAERADPAWTFGQCLLVAAGRPHPGLAARVARAVDRHGAEAARAWARDAGPRAAGQFERALAARDAPLAPPEDWPAVLRDPPWRRKGARAEPSILVPEPIPTPFHRTPAPDAAGRAWRGPDAGSRVLPDLAELGPFVAAAEAASAAGGSRPAPAPAADDIPGRVLAWLDRRLRRGGENPPGYPGRYLGLIRGAAWQPEPLALMLWEQTGHMLQSYVPLEGCGAIVLDRFGDRAVPGLAALIEADPSRAMPLAAGVDAADLAPAMARLLGDRKGGPEAAGWLRRHPRTAALRLLPDALGAAGPARDAAEVALRWLAGSGPEGRSTVDAAVAAYAAVDPRVPAAVAAGLDRDPIDRVPPRVGKAPAWAVPNALSRPRLTSGGALPDEAVLRVVEMLSFSTPLAPYAGFAVLRDACTADSLDAFARDLCAAWAANGASPRQDWALWGTAWLGGDGSARDLVRSVRSWATDGAKARALLGLDVLAAMGSDVALTGLAAIAAKSPFKALRERAEALVAAVAEARGLTAEALADRVAADLGLDARGGLDLDFGPRRFRVGFDELLRPWVRDAAGARLRALPRPNKADDHDLAKAAAARWAGLKKDAEATASLQVSRLEAMLVSQRRVSPSVFRAFFADHPLMRHLAGRLVWGLYGRDGAAEAPRATFRVADDLSLTDAADEPALLDASGLVGLVHPLHLDADLLGRWGALFADYEIVQPFPQLGREVFRLSESEAAGETVERFVGVEVAGRRLRGMRPHGWVAEPHGESFGALNRELRVTDGRALTAVLAFSPGLWRDPRGEGDPPQTLGRVTLFDPEGARGAAAPRFGALAPVTASEMLRGPALLAAAGRD